MRVPQQNQSRRVPKRIIFAAIVAILALMIGLATWWLKSQMANIGFTSDRTVERFVVGDDAIELPLNTIRFASQRESASQKQIDLAVTWPDGEGYTQANGGTFTDSSGIKDLIFITLQKRELQLDMSQRLEPIYRKLIVSQPTGGPAGLVFYTLKSGAGYDGEQLAVSQNGTDVWVARCQDDSISDHPTCLRDIHRGKTLSARYRFSRERLNEWRAIEEHVVGKVEDALASATR